MRHRECAMAQTRSNAASRDDPARTPRDEERGRIPSRHADCHKGETKEEARAVILCVAALESHDDDMP